MIVLWTLAALAGGFSGGLLGLYLIGLNMPMLGVGMAHAAMAGAVFAHLVGAPPQLWALLAALVAGMLLARLAIGEQRSDLGIATGILLSLTMGLAFLGIGLHRGDMTPLLSLMWGNILFVRERDVAALGAVAFGLALFVGVSRRPLDAMLFSRTAARAAGLDAGRLMAAFMAMAALVITIDLKVVGGLLMYALLTNPAAAAYELAESMPAARRWAAGLGAGSALAGFALSYALDLPTGACIVIVSTVAYAGAVVAARRRGWGRGV